MKRLISSVWLIVAVVAALFPAYHHQHVEAQGTHLILFWDGDTIPAGWTCISDAGGEPFYNRFPRGADTYGSQGGSAEHTHDLGFLLGFDSGSMLSWHLGIWDHDVAAGQHDHGINYGSTTGRTGPNLPPYRSLKVIRCNTAGTQPIPAGAIAIFHGSPPSGWTRYAAQDNRFIMGYGSVTTGGSETHSHNLHVVTTHADSSVTVEVGLFPSISQDHYHTIDVTTDPASHVPPYLSVILAEASTVLNTPPPKMVAMFDDSPPQYWEKLSGSGGVYNGRFLMGSPVFGNTGGAGSHYHNLPDITETSGAYGGTLMMAGISLAILVSSSTHTHGKFMGQDILDVRSTGHLPPYTDVIVAQYVPPPTVATSAATNVEATTATLGGSVTAINDTSITERGFVWDAVSRSAPSGAPPGSYANNWTETGTFGTGDFNRDVTGLPSGTTIYYRAGAENSENRWGYGDEVTFLTKPAAPTGVSATDGTYTDIVVISWIKSTGATDYQVYRDGIGLGWLGDVATYDDTGADAPTITPGTATASDGTSTAHVTLTLSGASASNGTTHSYTVIARNATGESAHSAADTGYRGTTTLTYQWQRSVADSDADYSDLSGATTDTYDDATAPAPTITPGTASASDGNSEFHVTLTAAGASANPGAGRYYRCVVSMSGATSQNSTADRGYRGVGTLTYQWYRSTADSDSNYSPLAGAASNPYDDTGAPAPTITPGTASASDGTSPLHVTLTITGASANVGDGRYYYCELSATGAANQNTNSDRGYRGVGALTYQWYCSAGDSDSSYSPLAGAASNPYDDTGAPAPTITPGTASASDGTSTAYVTLTLSGAGASNGAGRYYYCELSATGAAIQNTNSDRGYRGTTTLTYQWQRSVADSDADYSDLSGATTDTYDDATAPAPTITPGTASASDGDSEFHVTLTVTGASANIGDGRYYKCVVSMSGAMSQNSTADRGYRGVGTLTYQWYRSAADSDDGYSLLAGATTNPYNDAGAPSNGSGRYYYCQLSATGAANQNTNSDRGYRLVIPSSQPRASPSPPTRRLDLLPPADVRLHSLGVNPSQAQVGQPVTILANVANNGGSSGSYSVILRINGRAEQQRNIEVSPGSAYPVRFTVTRSQPGTYEVDVNGQKSFFTIAVESSRPRFSISGTMIAIIAAGSLVFVFLIYLLIIYIGRRRYYH